MKKYRLKTEAKLEMKNFFNIFSKEINRTFDDTFIIIRHMINLYLKALYIFLIYLVLIFMYLTFDIDLLKHFFKDFELKLLVVFSVGISSWIALISYIVYWVRKSFESYE